MGTKENFVQQIWWYEGEKWQFDFLWNLIDCYNWYIDEIKFSFVPCTNIFWKCNKIFCSSQ